MRPVAVDVMGGDFGPSVVVKGAQLAARDFSIPIALVGPESELRPLLDDGISLISFINATETIGMDENAPIAVRAKAQSSMREAFRAVHEGRASSVVSCGNTGGVMAAGLVEAGLVPGVIRPAIASCLPRMHGGPPIVFLDSGANVDSSPEQLLQFAHMGVAYARKVCGLSRPRVALLSNGAERGKGNVTCRAAYELISAQDSLHFVGYVEGHDLCGDRADVVVCDGFTGNIVLKAIEGTVGLVRGWLSKTASGTILGKLGLGLARPALVEMFQSGLSASARGGAPLLGLRAPTIVCHGASDSLSVKNAVRLASELASQKLEQILAEELSTLKKVETPSKRSLWRKVLWRKRRPRGEDTGNRKE